MSGPRALPRPRSSQGPPPSRLASRRDNLMDETVLREPSQAPRGLNGRPGLREEQGSRRRRWPDELAHRLRHSSWGRCRRPRTNPRRRPPVTRSSWVRRGTPGLPSAPVPARKVSGTSKAQEDEKERPACPTAHSDASRFAALLEAPLPFRNISKYEIEYI